MSFSLPPYLTLHDGFNVSQPVENWSTILEFDMPYSQFEQIATAYSSDHKHRLTGFVTFGTDSIVNSLTTTRYPRLKYGIATIPECDSHANGLATALGATRKPDSIIHDCRIVMGLIEGYDPQAHRHTINEVTARLAEARVTPAQIFSTRLSESEVSIYTEPVAVIDTPYNGLCAVIDLANNFKQERITVEDFSGGLTFTVETPHCTEPDSL